MTNCKKCNANLASDYCSFCGCQAVPPKINRAYIVEELRNIFNFERGFLFTLKALVSSPGENIRIFIEKDRNRMVKPIIFLIMCSLVYTFVLQFIGVNVVYGQLNEEDKTLTISMFTWTIYNSGYSNIIMSIFIGFWLQIFFRDHKFNFFEVLVLLCFVIGFGMLIYTVFLMLAHVSDINLDIVASVVGFIYSAWAIGSFYDGHKIHNCFKALVAYILGAISYYVSIFVLGASLSAILHFYEVPI